jgi:hypothetical protein
MVPELNKGRTPAAVAADASGSGVSPASNVPTTQRYRDVTGLRQLLQRQFGREPVSSQGQSSPTGGLVVNDVLMSEKDVRVSRWSR